MLKQTYIYRLTVANELNVAVQCLLPDGRVEPGDPSGAFGLGPHKDEITRLSQKAFANTITAAELRELGQSLYACLFDAQLGQHFLQYYEKVRQADQLLRLELLIDEAALPRLSAFPWEFLRIPPNKLNNGLWLSTTPGIIFARRPRQWQPPQPIQLNPDEPLRIAVMVARPLDDHLQNIAFTKLFAELEALATQMGNQIQFHLHDPAEYPANSKTIDAVLEKVKPHIFHLVGHGRSQNEAGEPVSELALVDEVGYVQWVDGATFSELFARHRPGVVLLDACEGAYAVPQQVTQAHSSVATQIVGQNIPVVIAMQYEITNAAVRKFAREFYRRLAQEVPDPVDKAFQEGRFQIAGSYANRQFATPVLFMRVADGRLFTRKLVKTTAPESETLRRALLRLNYTNQEQGFNRILFKPQRLGAFLITGPRHSGQRWLLKRLVENRFEQPAKKAVHIVIGADIISEDIAHLWQHVGQQLALHTGDPQQVSEALKKERQTQNILIVLDEVTALYDDYPDEVISGFWRPLVQALGLSQPGSNWVALFMLDHEQLLPGEDLEIIDLTQPEWQPSYPIPLEALTEKFPRSDIETWLTDRDTLQVEPLAQRVMADAPALVEEILQGSRQGVPLRVLSKVCHLCGHNWRLLEETWLKL